MSPRLRIGPALLLLLSAGSMVSARAAERITLRSGFAIVCDHREALDSSRVRLFLDGTATNYLEVAAADIATAEPDAALLSSTPAATLPPTPAALNVPVLAKPSAPPSGQPLDALIQRAGERRKLNIDLLRAVVNAESGGRSNAVSRVGAQGLMQLMPSTARSLGVSDSFAPEQNLRGGTDYLDTLLRRYHDDLQLALAAYNAGPSAVDRYHGIPPYRETRLYVARIIREFNRRTLAERAHASAQVAAAR